MADIEYREQIPSIREMKHLHNELLPDIWQKEGKGHAVNFISNDFH
jgi:hypothetical protein